MIQPLLGLLVLLLLAWAASEHRSAVRPRVIVIGLVVQLALALALLKLPLFQQTFLGLNHLVLALQSATEAGTAFVFGYLGGGDAPFETAYPTNSFVLAFRALPLLLVVSTLSSLLFYWRVLPRVVGAIGWILSKGLGIGGALGLGAAANIFIGMTEAPLLIKPYLHRLTRAELFGLMSCGMATVAGTVMVLYAAILREVLPDAMGHILTASVLSAPAALMIAHMLVPDDEPGTATETRPVSPATSSMDAISRGTLDGIQLLVNIVAMLVVLVALVHLANQLLGVLPDFAGEPLTLQRLLGWVMAPLVWLIGVPWAEAQTAGSLMGIKTVLNELLAYIELAGLPDEALTPRSRVIMTYALCGFANFGSLGIMIGGLGALVPERRSEVVALGIKSIYAGTLATLMTGAVVGLVL
jgi:CNT family concentrative nucleoside transporter